MNDFTKEELNLLLTTIKPLRSRAGLPSLFNKMRDMIDNYCDHPEPYRMMYGATILDYCDKCKHIFKFIEG